MSSLTHGWTRQPDVWRRFDDQLSAESWQRSPFHPSWTEKIPAVPGVYAVTGSPPIQGPFGDAWCPLYVGHTTNLRGRFKNHLNGDVGTLRLVFVSPSFYYLPLIDRSTRQLRGFEQLLLDAFGPICNSRNAITTKIGTPVPLSTLKREDV